MTMVFLFLLLGCVFHFLTYQSYPPGLGMSCSGSGSGSGSDMVLSENGVLGGGSYNPCVCTW